MVDFGRYYYSTSDLYGDDFTPEQIAEWFKDEEYGYVDLAASSPSNPQVTYPYDLLNEMHGYRHIRGRHFQRCLGLGVGSGQDVRPIAGQVDRFYCVEPGRDWWTSDLFGRPATFAMPKADGSIDLPDGSCDMAVALSVLHHIPNVTAVLREMARVMASGGVLLVREPIVTMGEWDQPRPGLTKHERGIPFQWLRSKMQSLRFETINEQLYGFRPLMLATSRLLRTSVYSRAWLLRADAAISNLTAFNVRYYRPSLWGKFAPAYVFAVYRKI